MKVLPPPSSRASQFRESEGRRRDNSPPLLSNGPPSAASVPTAARGAPNSGPSSSLCPRQAPRTLSQARSLSHWLVFEAISRAFIAKSYHFFPKLTFWIEVRRAWRGSRRPFRIVLLITRVGTPEEDPNITGLTETKVENGDVSQQKWNLC